MTNHTGEGSTILNEPACPASSHLLLHHPPSIQIPDHSAFSIQQHPDSEPDAGGSLPDVAFRCRLHHPASLRSDQSITGGRPGLAWVWPGALPPSVTFTLRTHIHAPYVRRVYRYIYYIHVLTYAHLLTHSHWPLLPYSRIHSTRNSLSLCRQTP